MTDFQDFNDEDDEVNEQKIRREYRNLDTVKLAHKSRNGFSFVIAKFLEVDERGGDIGTSPLAYKSHVEEDGPNTVVLASHALQTEQGVAYLLRSLRRLFLEGDLDEAVAVVDEAKRALGMDCEEYIAMLRAERVPAKMLMQKQAERVNELKAAAEVKKLPPAPKKAAAKSQKKKPRGRRKR